MREMLLAQALDWALTRDLSAKAIKGELLQERVEGALPAVVRDGMNRRMTSLVEADTSEIRINVYDWVIQGMPAALVKKTGEYILVQPDAGVGAGDVEVRAR